MMSTYKRPTNHLHRFSDDLGKQRRIFGWMALILVLSLVDSRGVESQIWTTEEEEAREEEEPITTRRTITPDDQETITGRQVALPITSLARRMAFEDAISARIEAGAQGVYLANIEGEIELGIAYYVGRVIKEAEAANAVLLIFQIETPGGRVDAAIDIRDSIIESSVPTVAFVNNRAWSAGALIALGHDLIVVTRGASIGAATPVQMGGGGTAEPVQEKVVSALRAEFRSAAEYTNRNPSIAEAMVDASIYLGGIIDSGRLLTITGNEALALGIAEARANTLAELLALFNLEDAEITEVEESWAESLVRVLTSPMVAGLLMTLGFLGIFFELTSPGFGWAGAMGIIALVVFFAGHLVVNLAGFEEVAIFVLGLLLLGVELFLLPGFGVAGVLGVLAITASLVMSMMGLDLERWVLSDVQLSEAFLRVGVSFIVTVVGAILILKLLPSTGIGQRLVLQTALASGSSLSTPPATMVDLGDRGETLTDLKPFGRARFGHKRVEVVSTGEMIERATKIRVTRVIGDRIEVQPIEQSDEQSDDSPDQNRGQ